MAYTLVGTSILTDATSPSPQTLTIPLPTGTQVGDFLVLWASAESAYSTTDARLTEHVVGGSTPALFTGVATTLADIDIEADLGYLPGLLYLVAVRGPSSTEYYGQEDELSGSYMANGDGSTILPPDVVGFAVSCTFDSAVSPATAPTMGTDGDGNWTALTEQAYTFSNATDTFDMDVRGYYTSGTLNALLIASVSGTSIRRQSRGVYFQPTAVTTTYLRQRQSPVRTPSRIRPPVVRQRQRPEVT